jgi:hypothetical protein
LGAPDCSSFGIVVRADADGGDYRAGTEHNCLGAGLARRYIARDVVLVEAAGGADGEWHTYRCEVRGDHLALFVDGVLLIEVVDSALPTGGQVGLWSDGAQVNVRAFTVTLL